MAFFKNINKVDDIKTVIKGLSEVFAAQIDIRIPAMKEKAPNSDSLASLAFYYFTRLGNVRPQDRLVAALKLAAMSVNQSEAIRLMNKADWFLWPEYLSPNDEKGVKREVVAAFVDVSSETPVIKFSDTDTDFKEAVTNAKKATPAKKEEAEDEEEEVDLSQSTSEETKEEKAIPSTWFLIKFPKSDKMQVDTFAREVKDLPAKYQKKLNECGIAILAVASLLYVKTRSPSVSDQAANLVLRMNRYGGAGLPEGQAFAIIEMLVSKVNDQVAKLAVGAADALLASTNVLKFRYLSARGASDVSMIVTVRNSIQSPIFWLSIDKEVMKEIEDIYRKVSPDPDRVRLWSDAAKHVFNESGTEDKPVTTRTRAVIFQIANDIGLPNVRGYKRGERETVQFATLCGWASAAVRAWRERQREMGSTLYQKGLDNMITEVLKFSNDDEAMTIREVAAHLRATKTAVEISAMYATFLKEKGELEHADLGEEVFKVVGVKTAPQAEDNE